MVQASNEQSRETYVEARGSVNYYHTNEPQTSQGWYWCYEKQGFFRYSDWNITLEEMEKKYG